MQHPAIHDAYADVTPSALLFAAQRRQRLARIAAGACPDTPIMLRAPVAVTPSEPPPETETEWAERQKKIPLPKEPWFSIVEEIEPPEPRKPRIEEIQAACAKHYGVRRFDILSARRTANVVRPRQVAMFLCKELTLRSLPEIGRRFGDRDHTTVLHAVNKIRLLATLSTNYVAEDIDAIKADIAQRLVS